MQLKQYIKILIPQKATQLVPEGNMTNIVKSQCL